MLATALSLGHLAAHAAPAEVATLDRTQWPEALSTPALFDVASRAQILSFSRELLSSEALDESTLADRLGLRQINMAAINALRERLWQRLWTNFDHAQQSCVEDASFCYAVDNLEDLKAQAGQFTVEADSFYARWAEPGRAFSRAYLDEQLHMAALLPDISSEVVTFSKVEHNGDELNDRVFLLTFDSGPSAAAGNTDWMTDFLRRQKMNATFFVLGNSVQLRRQSAPAEDLDELYRDQCVGVQGWQYRSHSQWLDWQDSILRSVALVQSQLPNTYVPQFRPPYGQRRQDSGEFFESQQLDVVLWDIDAQDSNTQLSAESSSDRVLTLMLLWRRGIIVFHDAQLKARTAVPALLTATAQSGIAWEDCRDFP
ncbi:polysaccharide deacetylase family protein [Pseudomonas sp. RIT-PI-S]|uniref:polysaccharide deacetylase family protein n=1 Tax=Pseudomonas sp. RIT-PI-S TaxID=3035295 RepID=UPI0021D9E1CA|nr:polysaccharide deacetylase family protein [Pseudomonas sp. RIT-PI-S]